MKPGIYEYGAEGSNNLVWVVDAEVVNGGYKVISDDDWQTCRIKRFPDTIARRVGDVPSIKNRDYTAVINAFIEQRKTK